MIRDFTGEFKKLARAWDKGARPADPWPQIRSGLYAFVFANPDATPVRDNNPNRFRVVIHPNGLSFKSGKFAGKLHSRLKEYWQHLRVDTDDGPKRVLTKCLRMLLVADISAHKLDAARLKSAETQWNRALRKMLGENGLRTATQRKAEWQYLMEGRESDALRLVREHVRALVSQVVTIKPARSPRTPTARAAKAPGAPRSRTAAWSQSEKSALLKKVSDDLAKHGFVSAGEQKGSKRFATTLNGAYYAVSFGQRAGSLRAEVYLAGSSSRARFGALTAGTDSLRAQGSSPFTVTPDLRLAFEESFEPANAKAAQTWAVRHVCTLRKVLGPLF